MPSIRLARASNPHRNAHVLRQLRDPAQDLPRAADDVPPRAWFATCNRLDSMYKLVTCPGTGRLEMVELVETPLGSLIHRCTRFRPTCALRCTRDCAAEIDREACSAPRTGGPVRASDGHWILERSDEDWTP
jgi:hypothetical protein